MRGVIGGGDRGERGVLRGVRGCVEMGVERGVIGVRGGW